MEHLGPMCIAKVWVTVKLMLRYQQFTQPSSSALWMDLNENTIDKNKM